MKKGLATFVVSPFVYWTSRRRDSNSQPPPYEWHPISLDTGCADRAKSLIVADLVDHDVGDTELLRQLDRGLLPDEEAVQSAAARSSGLLCMGSHRWFSGAVSTPLSLGRLAQLIVESLAKRLVADQLDPPVLDDLLEPRAAQHVTLSL